MTTRNPGEGRRSPARWRKLERTSISAGFGLYRDGVRLAMVAQLPNGRWYWCGGGKNTLDDAITFADPDKAKADAKARCS